MCMLCSIHDVLTQAACPHYAVLLQYCTIGFLHPHSKNTHQDFSTPIRLAERKLVWQHSFEENQQHWSHTDLICTYCQSRKLGDGNKQYWRPTGSYYRTRILHFAYNTLLSSLTLRFLQLLRRAEARCAIGTTPSTVCS
jgi:hypothetical protein